MTPEEIRQRIQQGVQRRGPLGGSLAVSGMRNESNAAAQQAQTLPGSGGGGSGGSFYGPYDQVLSGYSDFANTGGFSPADLAAIRARSISPIRANYANAEREVNRQKSLQGGYSPGFGVLRARMAREQGQAGAEATTGAEAGIAQMVQQGKLAGLGGLAGLVGREGGGGGGGGEDETLPVPEKKKGFWGKLGSGLKKVGQIALPIALSAIPGGSLAGAGLKKVGLGAATR